MGPRPRQSRPLWQSSHVDVGELQARGINATAINANITVTAERFSIVFGAPSLRLRWGTSIFQRALALIGATTRSQLESRLTSYRNECKWNGKPRAKRFE